MNTLAKYILHTPNALCKPLCMAALLCGLSALAGIVTGCEDKPLAFNYCSTPVEGWEPGDTLKFPAYTYIGDATVINENGQIVVGKLEAGTVQATVHKYGKAIAITGTSCRPRMY